MMHARVSYRILRWGGGDTFGGGDSKHVHMYWVKQKLHALLGGSGGMPPPPPPPPRKFLKNIAALRLRVLAAS